MKVFWVKPSLEHQELLLEPDTGLSSDDVRFEGIPRASNWIQPDVYIENPLKPAGSFYRFGNNGIAVSKAGDDDFGHLLAADCELLPMRSEDGTEFYAVNTITCVNCLDKQRSLDVLSANGIPLGISRIIFNEKKLPVCETLLFVVPETAYGHLYTIEREGDQDHEFKAYYEQNGLTGLTFVLIWDSELPDDKQPGGPYWVAPIPGWLDNKTLRPIAERPPKSS